MAEFHSKSSQKVEEGRSSDLVLTVCGFGRLVSVKRHNPDNPTDEQMETVYELLDAAGFFAVDRAEALIPYTGVFETRWFKPAESTWDRRFFGY